MGTLADSERVWRLLSVSNRTTIIVITFRHGRKKADQHNALTSSAFLISDAYNFKDLKIKQKHHHHIDDYDQHTYRACRKWPGEPSLPQFASSRGSCHSPPKGQPRLFWFTQMSLPPHTHLLNVRGDNTTLTNQQPLSKDGSPFDAVLPGFRRPWSEVSFFRSSISSREWRGFQVSARAPYLFLIEKISCDHWTIMQNRFSVSSQYDCFNAI